MDERDGLTRGSRKFAVSLFADLTGYTALCERLDPEDVERAVAPLMMGMQEAVVHAQGAVLNVAGDGLFAIFGVPTALADSPERAVRVAQQMRDLVADTSAKTHGIALPDVHIGVAAGEVLLTQVARQGSWSVIGTSANLASRLCDAASGGEVLVDGVCHEIVKNKFQWDEPRTLTLKGQDAPAEAWPLTSTCTEQAHSTRPEVFIGRARLLAALDGELETVKSQHVNRTVVLRGVAGIGKSALVREWIARHPELEAWRVECDEGWNDDLHALSDALDPTHLDLPSSDTRHQPPVDRADPFPLVVHALRSKLQESVADRPRALVIENLHTSDTILGEFLLELAKDPLDQPLLVIATWRDESTGVTKEPHLLGRTLPLGPLEAAESDRLFEALIGEHVDQETLAIVAERTAGHPLMVGESAWHLAALRSRLGGSDHAVKQEFRDSLPTSLRMFLAARLDRLDGAARAIVHDLSALGSHFSREWVEIVLGRRAADALPVLAKEGILTRAEEWSFSHDLQREVAYSTLTRTQRADLHRRQLSLLASDADPHIRTEHALAWNQSVSPVDREQYDSSTVAAVRETLALTQRLYERQARAALQAARRATGAARDCVALEPALTAQLWALEAQCLAELGHNDEALSLAARADQTAADAGIPALRLPPMMTRGYVLSSLRRFESARQTLDDAAQIAEQLGDHSGQAEAIRLLADTWRHSLLSRHVELTEEAYRLFDSADDRRGAGECARTLAYLSSVGGGARFTKWRDIAVQLTEPNDVRATAALAKADALAMGCRFQFQGYKGAGRTLVAAGETLEAPDLLSEGLLDIADASVYLGDAAAAREASLRLIELATSLGDRRMRATAAAAAARPLLRTGESARSSEELRIAAEMAAEFGEGEATYISIETFVCLADRGDWASALRAVQDTLETVDKVGFSLGSLASRCERLRVTAVLTSAWSSQAAQQLASDAEDLDAPLVASYARALDAWAHAALGEAVTVSDAPEDACLDELAIRADTAALHLQLRGEDATKAWCVARELWERLGYTIWLARAQARSGDLEAAHHTLEVLDSPAQARAWALGEAAAT